MAGALHGVIASLKSAAAAATDAFFRYVSLLLNTTSTNGAQNNTFLDSSTNNFSITRNGNTTQGTFSPFSQTGWSNFFDGTGDWLSVPDNAAFEFGSGDLTAEAWVYLTGYSPASFAVIVSKNENISTLGFYLLVGGTTSSWTSVTWQQYYSGTLNEATTGSFTFNLNTWYHVAVTKSSGSVRLFVNGTQVNTTATFTQTQSNSTAAVYIGGQNYAGNNYPLTGYISNVRLVKGTAVYTSAFTPPTTPLTNIANTSLLTCQSNRFIDNSSNAFAITPNGDVSVQAFSPFNPTAAWDAGTNGGSGYFDGTGDYLSAASNAAFAFGTGDFTAEAWVFRTAAPSFGSIYAVGYTVGGFGLAIEADGDIVVTRPGTAIDHTFAANVATNQWAHIAIARSGTSLYCFLNGTQIGATATNNTNYAQAILYVGIDGNGTSQPFQGYISNARIVKGTAVYTAAFTPPTAPLTAITNTSLLCNFTNAGIFDSASGNDLETVGNAQVSTTVAKWGTTSMAFDGTGDWLLNIDKPALRLGTAAFTIEMWVYRSASGTYGLVSKGTSTTGWSVSLNASNQVVFSFTTSSITSTGTVAATTWTHIAVVREGTGSNQTKIYISGTNDGTGTVSTDFNQTNAMYVGADRVAGGAFNGYIDDLRITNGYARYTSNFTAPTAAFPLN